MKSIAVWCKKINQNEPAPESIELHFNLWKIPDHKSSHLRFIDIGLKLETTVNVKSVKCFFPYEIIREHISDVAPKFIRDNKLIDAIFNENYRTTTDSTHSSCEIKDANDSLVFKVYTIEDEKFNLEHKFSGSILSINCAQEASSAYFRFRIEGPYLDTLYTTQNPPNSVLQSAFSQLEVIDFRINEARDLPSSLLDQMRSETQLQIKKAHFFFICSSEDEVVGSHLPFLSCRNLESNTWAQYIGGTNLKVGTNNLAYHWKWSDKKDLNILIKSKYEQNNWKTISYYLIGVIGIGVLVNLISYYITKS